MIATLETSSLVILSIMNTKCPSIRFSWMNVITYRINFSSRNDLVKCISSSFTRFDSFSSSSHDELFLWRWIILTYIFHYVLYHKFLQFIFSYIRLIPIGFWIHYVISNPNQWLMFSYVVYIDIRAKYQFISFQWIIFIFYQHSTYHHALTRWLHKSGILDIDYMS